MVKQGASALRRLIIRLDVDWPKTLAVILFGVIAVAASYAIADAFSAIVVAIVGVFLFCPPLFRGRAAWKVLAREAPDGVRFVVMAKLISDVTITKPHTAVGLLCLTNDSMCFFSRASSLIVPIASITSLAYRRALLGKISSLEVSTAKEQLIFMVRNPRLLYLELAAMGGN